MERQRRHDFSLPVVHHQDLFCDVMSSPQTMKENQGNPGKNAKYLPPHKFIKECMFCRRQNYFMEDLNMWTCASCTKINIKEAGTHEVKLTKKEADVLMALGQWTSDIKPQ